MQRKLLVRILKSMRWMVKQMIWQNHESREYELLSGFEAPDEHSPELQEAIDLLDELEEM